MKFEFADPGDKSKICELLARCGLPDEDITPSHLKHFLVAYHKEKLAGVVGLEPFQDHALLRSLAVEAHVRGQGIASQLVEKIEAYARAHEIESLYLLTTTAEGFFEKHGYLITRRDTVPDVLKDTEEFKSICPETAVCMVKIINPNFS